MPWFFPLFLILAAATSPTTAPSTRPQVGRLPQITVDARHRVVRVQCQSLHPEMPLEFLCCVRGTHDYESVLRSRARPRDLHLALLMIGLKPGSPARYSEDQETWFPPHGPALVMEVEFHKDGRMVRMPAWKLLRHVGTKKAAPPMTWIFAGSKFLPDGRYAADLMGYLVSLVNFNSTLIDVPYVASNANQTLQWEYNPDTTPPAGTPVTLIIRPAGTPDSRPSSPPGSATQSAPPPTTRGRP